jgi:hypothetical protein
MALMATHEGERQYVGVAVIGLNRAMRERLCAAAAGLS